jgi:hypothetical protein
MRQNVARLAFNRGLVSRLGLARADIKRLAFSAEVQTNWMTRVLGSMMLRPGLGFLDSTFGDDAARFLPFVFSIEDKALLELTDQLLRVWISDAVLTRGSVSSAISNGTFTTDLTGWTDADESGGVSAWATGGYMGLTGNGTAFAIRRQQVTVAAADQNDEHALRIVVERGPVILRVGSASAGDEYITETSLGTGVHSLAFTPTGSSFWVEFKSRLHRIVLVDECTVEAAGDMEVETPWLEADLGLIRHDQSGDIVFVAADGYQQWTIERRAAHSWSVVLYEPEDGPFLVENVSTTTITASVLNGNGTLTASKPLFRPGHDGALFRVTSTGQRVNEVVTAENTFSDPITIEGVDSSRVFTIIRSGLSGTSSTVTLQRSLTSDTGPWEDVVQYTTDATITFDDALDNQIAYYRIGVKTSDYSSGTIDLTLDYALGSITGIARVTAFTTSLLVDIEVLVAFGGTSASEVWSEGEWSDYRGYPTSVALYEGRLGWSGRDKVWLSVSDGFYSFDDQVEGDSGPINRSIGSGPVDRINWMLALQRLLLGGQGAEFSCRSSSFDEPLTPLNFNLKRSSTQGSSAVSPMAVDSRGIFVQRGGTRVYELAFDGDTYDYGSSHLSAIVPEIGQPGIVRAAVQRQPDTRVHFVRSDGTVAVLVFDKVENVICWLEVETDGDIEDVVVLPGDDGEEEDWVYYVVKRTINSVTKRYVEKWALESECRGDEDECKLADSFIVYSGPAVSTITGLSHLEGEQVVVWADGADVGTDEDGDLIYTVASGQITLAAAATPVVVGLPYTGQWKSAKMVELATQIGTAMGGYASIKGLALILADVHAKGLQFGTTFAAADLNDMPSMEAGAPVDADAVRTDYASEKIVFPGNWSTDARLCLQAKAPRPCTVLAAIAEVEFHA